MKPVGIVIGILILLYHAMYAFYSLVPTGHWFVYHSVVPVKKEFAINERLKFISHTDLKRPVHLTFNDILFCRDPQGGDFERYSQQNTARLHNLIGNNRYTVWPYSPGVPFETECYLESNIKVHLPMHIERTFRYDGYLSGITFRIVDKEVTDDEEDQ